ncbi:unnamed protein product [Linum trigynum]|uniref:S-protein homolog n=1 Tax=Linum trigynum TaxID=586398 RepID=A0AAV2D2W5_9ROSI
MAPPLISAMTRIVNINNKVSSEKALIVHCASADDDLGARAMNYGEAYSWHFDDHHVILQTLFWCHLALEDGRLSFDAYHEGQPEGGYEVINWDINETGAYSPDHSWFTLTWRRIRIP